MSDIVSFNLTENDLQINISYSRQLFNKIKLNLKSILSVFIIFCCSLLILANFIEDDVFKEFFQTNLQDKANLILHRAIDYCKNRNLKISYYNLNNSLKLSVDLIKVDCKIPDNLKDLNML